jgi:elongation factor Ts
MSIDAKTVKELRDKTGAGMMDCKKALTETAGDLEAAIAYLREKGLASAAKKSGRVAAEGAVAIYGDTGAAVLLELNCETDFVAKNDQFSQLLDQVGAGLLAADVHEGTGETVQDLALGGGATMGSLLTDAIANIGENISLRRFVKVSACDGIVGSYVHAGGKIGVLVDMVGATADDEDLARSLGMQVAAAFPRCTRRDEVAAEDIERESEIFRNQALEQGKPEKILDKIIAGKLEKFYSEICLLEQAYVKDPDLTVTKLLEQQSKETGRTLTVRGFVRFQLGEGIEKKTANLAEEVAQQIAQGS